MSAARFLTDEEKATVRRCGELSGHDMINCMGNLFPAIPNVPIARHDHTKPPPSVIVRGLNFGWSLLNWAASGFPTRTKEEIEERLKICEPCEFFDNGVCTECGCGCNSNALILNKISLKTEVCPKGKWT